jgi:hypothetical protein
LAIVSCKWKLGRRRRDYFFLIAFFKLGKYPENMLVIQGVLWCLTDKQSSRAHFEADEASLA